jgi:hypothetical protein
VSPGGYRNHAVQIENNGLAQIFGYNEARLVSSQLSQPSWKPASWILLAVDSVTCILLIIEL